MASSSAILVMHLILASVLANLVQPRPRNSIGYFPSQPHPWSIGAGNSEDEGILGNLIYPDDEPKYNNYILSYRQSLGPHEDGPLTKEKLSPKFPIYTNIQDGFVPADLTALDSVYWWKKRFPGSRSSLVDDLPYFHENSENNMVEMYNTGNMKKRDYTAAQLINMLKALAKARRQRQVRITGKGLRFGISK